MTLKPEPGDLENAEKLIEAWRQHVIVDEWNYAPELVAEIRIPTYDLPQRVALALKAEREDQRERDAKIADEHAAKYRDSASDGTLGEMTRWMHSDEADGAEAVAAAIRSGGSPQPEEEKA